MHILSKIFTTVLLFSTGPNFLTLASPMAMPEAAPSATGGMSARSANTCADPSVSQVYYQGFDATGSVHFLNTWINLANFNTFTDSPSWIDLRPAFHAWQDQQSFTVPLFALVNGGATEYLFMIGADAQSPPLVGGFSNAGLIAWVYNTPVCGSVPLLSAVNAAATDHFYTINADEHSRLVAIGGWADTGIIAYVLPVTAP